MTTNKIENFLPVEICRLYEVFNYRNAAQVLSTGCRDEFTELMAALGTFRLTLEDIRKPGGNKSDIPKRLSKLLTGNGWLETRIKGDLLITKVTGPARRSRRKKGKDEEEGESETLEIISERKQRGQGVEIRKENFLDGHKVDHVKNRVAFDIEWNSKDQTFDRDLYAFRAFHECDLIDVAVILTRSVKLNPVFEKLGPEMKKDRPKLLKAKYGASTTWMGKLLYRLNAGRPGGCPVLALGITPALITDWEEFERTYNANPGAS
jgi:CRISPR-associated protein Csd2